PSTSSPSTSGTSGTATGAPVITVTAPTESANVSTRSDFTIAGTATTPGIGPSDIDRVQVYINGEKDTGTLLGETTPASDTTWNVGFPPTHSATTPTNTYPYEHSTRSGTESEYLRRFD